MSGAQRIVRSYAELISAIRERRISLGISQRELDFRAGLADGYTSKLEIWADRTHGRFLGMKSLNGLMQALGIGFVIATQSVPLGESPDKRLKIANRRHACRNEVIEQGEAR